MLRYFYWCNVTSRDAKTLRYALWGLDTSDRYFDQEQFETNQKSLVVFVFSVTLTLTFDICDIDLDL